MGNLTALEVEKIRARPGRYCDGQGLWLFVASSSSASWIFRYSVDGVQRAMGLGSLRNVPLKQARRLAEKARSIRADGKDPNAERRQEAKERQLEASRQITFRECAEEFLRLRGAKWRNGKYAAQVPSLLQRYAYPVIGSLPVREVSTANIVELLRPVWITKHPTAKKLRGNIEAVLDWSTSVQHRGGENPARFKGHLEHHLAELPKIEQRHHAALPYKDVPAFMEALKNQVGIGALSLRFLILTAARTNEAIGATWEEIDRDEAVWNIRAGRMKGGRTHRVPLSQAALDVLDEAMTLSCKSGARSGFIFEGAKSGKHLSNAAMSALLKRIGRVDVTVHGFRAAFRDWSRKQRPAFSWELCELSLAHLVGDATARAYARDDLLDERRPLMEAWASFVPARNVVPLRIASR